MRRRMELIHKLKMSGTATAHVANAETNAKNAWSLFVDKHKEVEKVGKQPKVVNSKQFVLDIDIIQPFVPRGLAGGMGKFTNT